MRTSSLTATAMSCCLRFPKRYIGRRHLRYGHNNEREVDSSCGKYPFIYAAVGFHALNLDSLTADWCGDIKKLAAKNKVVAIGEIGLDYHYERDSREKQLEVFEKQLVLANELSLPVIVHDREAHEDTLNLLKKHRPRGVVHCFSGSVETAKEIIKLGMYIGLGGAVTFKMR